MRLLCKWQEYWHGIQSGRAEGEVGPCAFGPSCMSVTVVAQNALQGLRERTGLKGGAVSAGAGTSKGGDMTFLGPTEEFGKWRETHSIEPVAVLLGYWGDRA